MPRQSQPASARRGRQPRWRMPDSRCRPARSRPRRPPRHHHRDPGPRRRPDPGSSHDASKTTISKEDLMDTSDVYPDLFGDALSYSSQRMAQLASLVTAAATVEARRKAQRNAAKTIRSERTLRELQDQERAAYQLARPAGRRPTIRGSWIRPTCSRQPARGARQRPTPMPTPKPLMLSAPARNGCVSCTRTRWPGMTGSAAKEPHRSTRCVRRCPCSPAPRTRVRATRRRTAQPGRPGQSWHGIAGQQRGRRRRGPGRC